MSKLVRIPEAVLAALLREAGRPESVDAFLAAVEAHAGPVPTQKLLRRARAAYWSRFWLLLSAAFSWIGLAAGWDLEDLIAGVLLTGMTVVEFKVYRLFLAGDPQGAVYGWWNQCVFALLFALYGSYHAVHPVVPGYVQSLIDPNMMDMLLPLEQFSYAIIGLVGAAGQFALACYYRTAAR